jgi:hypothetical protein
MNIHCSYPGRTNPLFSDVTVTSVRLGKGRKKRVRRLTLAGESLDHEVGATAGPGGARR